MSRFRNMFIFWACECVFVHLINMNVLNIFFKMTVGIISSWFERLEGREANGAS